MKNKLTILVDGGFLMQSRAFAFEKGFKSTNTEAQKRRTAEEFKDTLSRTIVKLINMFPADNVVLMSEGGSWRKKLPVPEQLKDITYKGNREKKSEVDWDYIYKAYSEFEKSFMAYGLTRSQNFMIEGDDWAWYWSRRLNAEGTSVIIWSSDCDLKQLVQVEGNAFTAWYNDRAGLVLPLQCQMPDDPIEAMLNPSFDSQELRAVVNKCLKVNYIHPDSIALEKIFCGDAGDNIKSVIRYQKNGRTYRFAEKDYKTLVEDLNIRNMADLVHNRERIAKYIAELPKYSQYNFKVEDIIEMLNYNIKLVVLHENIMPDTVIKSMVQTEYKVPDIKPLKLNNKLLLEQNKSIEDTFYSIFD